MTKSAMYALYPLIIVVVVFLLLLLRLLLALVLSLLRHPLPSIFQNGSPG
jgi:hypothetical protein